MRTCYAAMCILFLQLCIPRNPACADDLKEHPNVVILLADDLGWKDVSCYGSTFCETPNIDALANGGVRFTQAYSAGSICSPTRASLMTGKYPARLGITDYIPGLRSKPNQMPTPRTVMQLPLEELTLGEMFQQQGYETFYSGKWHLGEAGFEPSDNGFDHYISDRVLGNHGQDWTVGTRIVESFDSFVGSRNSEKPFLAYLAFHEPHTPILEYPSHISRFREKSEQLGPAPSPIIERDGKTRARADDAAYGSEVAGLDDLVGHVMSTLTRQGLVDETIVVFLSDNGGLSTKAQPGPTNNAPLRAGKGWLYEGGIRIPLIIKMPGDRAASKICEQQVMSFDIVPTVLELAGLEAYPESHVDARSVANQVRTPEAALPQRAIYWHYPHYHGSTWAPGAAMRVGDWKLIQFDHYRQVELYNLGTDLGEQHDVAAQHPKIAHAMQAQLAQWQASLGVQFATPRNMLREELVAWCVVPFDASHRDPIQRSEMLRELGLRRLAYDWREEHVATWDAELDALKKNDIQLTAFWCSSSLDPTNDPGTQRIVEFLRRRNVATQLWVMLPDNELAKISDPQARVERAANSIVSLANQVEPLGCQVGLYNHGGWVGRPDSMVKIIELAKQSADNVGLVYNFHHSHEDLDSQPQSLRQMKPYLLCLNLNGMELGGEKILPIGRGKLDSQVLSWIRQVQYAGPIGVLDHRPELDAKESLLENLEGLESLLNQPSR
ncbi:MAG: sulfatase-like hydrolase/transferase [Planctomycetales bacterium]|nr:sulfatase-like hydrolase/transferase [Planctomycetales bacterium]